MNNSQEYRWLRTAYGVWDHLSIIFMCRFVAVVHG